MAKPTTPRRPLGAPPHPLAGYYLDSCNNRYWVPSRPDFALYRLDAEGQPVDASSPVQNKPDEFRAAVAFGTFTRINH